MQRSEPLGPVRFGGAVLAIFLLGVLATDFVTRQADVLNQSRHRLPTTQGLPRVLHSYPALANTWLANTAAASDAETWVIGTSISLYGFDPCSLPNTANFSRSSGIMQDAVQWAGKAARDNPSVQTIVLELSLGEARVNSFDMGPRAMDVWLAVWKLSAVDAWNASAPEAGSCASPFSDADRPLRQINLPPPSVLRERSDDILDLSGDLGAWCAAEPGRRVVFFQPPMNPVVETAQPELPAALAGVTPVLAALVEDFVVRNPGCNASFTDLKAPRATPEDWIDANHFRPSLGNRLLGGLLARP